MWKMSTVIVLFCLLFGKAYGVPTRIFIEQLDYDPTTRKVSVVYNPGLGSATGTDEGPILLCAINRLLKAKYEFYLGLEEGQKIGPEDLLVFGAASSLMLENSKVALRSALSEYRSDASKKAGDALFKALVDGIYATLENHRTHFRAERSRPSRVAKELSAQLQMVESKKDALSVPDGELEKQLLAKYEKDIARLKAELARQNPEKYLDEAEESPVDWSICLDGEGSKSQNALTNENVDELLVRARQIANQISLARTAPRNRNGEAAGAGRKTIDMKD